jgi:Protein of unknown function (DUF2934)
MGVESRVILAELEPQPTLPAPSWEEEGRPEGKHLQHWLRAEAETNAAAEQPKN